MTSRVIPSRGPRWPAVPVRMYKDDPALYRDVARWTLLGGERDDAALACEVRYFEVAPGGWTTLERHDHPHAVVVIAGRGTVRLGEELHELAPFDAVYVAPGDPHQFRADRGEPLGFLCVVDRERDRPVPLAEARAPRAPRAVEWRPYWTGRERARRGAGELLVSPPLGGTGVPAREVLVYLPPGHGEPGVRYPVVYLQDGQNLFDDATAFTASWGAAESVDELAVDGPAPILVGIPNAGERRAREYSPFVDRRLGGGGARAYLAFLLEVVAPRVERDFAPATTRAERIVGGSSLGALFALWSLFTAPAALGAALAMSPTTLFAGEALQRFLARARRPESRVYLDCGLEEGRRGGGRRRRGTERKPTAYVRRVRRLRRTLEQRGFRPGVDLVYVEDPEGDHSEAAWGGRLPGALSALLTR